MKIETVREQPIEPPISHILINLTLAEAAALVRGCTGCVLADDYKVITPFYEALRRCLR